MNGKKEGLTRLSQLVSQPGQSSPPAVQEYAPGEEDLTEDANKVLDFVRQIAGDNIFDAQALIEFCAEELRIQIREQAEGDEEGDDT